MVIDSCQKSWPNPINKSLAKYPMKIEPKAKQNIGINICHGLSP